MHVADDDRPAPHEVGEARGTRVEEARRDGGIGHRADPDINDRRPRFDERRRDEPRTTDGRNEDVR
jgi:hypothetical protein